MRNESSESKRNVTCSICNQTGRRDNMQRNQFPRKNPGVNYFGIGDKIVKAAEISKNLLFDILTDQDTNRNKRS